MRFIARFAMRGPFYAAATAAIAQLASLSIGLFIIISGAVIGLTTLRQGSSEGLRVLVFATAMVVAARLFIDGQALPMLVLSLVIWLPAWLLALNLARTRRQALALLMVAALVGAYTSAIRLTVDDVAAFWRERLELLLKLLAEGGGQQFTAEQVDYVAGQLHVWSLMVMFYVLIAIVLLARWWQSELFNPGGFGSEFRELRLPRFTLIGGAVVALLLLVASVSGADWPLVGDAFVIVVLVFAFQGLAVIHFRARAVRLATGWMTGLYVLLMLTPQIVGPILATAGVADGIADFRGLSKRLATPGKPSADDDD